MTKHKNIFRDNFLSVTNHGADGGDISDGISVISDCESIFDRHSPMPVKMASHKQSEDYQETDKNQPSGIEDIRNYSLVERSTDTEVQVLSRDTDTSRHYHIWNPTNIILFGLIIGAAAVLSSQCWKINSSHESILPEMSKLVKRIQVLETENSALKLEVSRLVQMYHTSHGDRAGHDHTRETVTEKRSIKQKKVWTGADDGPVHIPKEPFRENYCTDEYLNSDDLFANYNFRKCEKIDDNDDDEQTMTSDSHRFDSRKKKNSTKDDNAANSRQQYNESKLKDVENQLTDQDESIRKEKLAKIQEERQKLFDEATQKYLERQKKMEKKQEKDRKKREDSLKESTNGRKQPKDSEWYDKMMKQREELRAMGNSSGGTKQRNKENWYIERANEREKVRGKHEKQTKSRLYH